MDTPVPPPCEHLAVVLNYELQHGNHVAAVVEVAGQTRMMLRQRLKIWATPATARVGPQVAYWDSLKELGLTADQCETMDSPPNCRRTDFCLTQNAIPPPHVADRLRRLQIFRSRSATGPADVAWNLADEYDTRMRYRLRTLMMVTTVCCFCAAWVGFVRHKAALHQRASNRIAAELALRAGWQITEMNTLVSNIASHSRGRVDSLQFQVDVPHDPRLEKHRQAVNHQILANNYGQAILRPWKIFEARFSP